MSQMFENNRWRTTMKLTPPGRFSRWDRWGRWARSLSSRHQRVVSRHRVAAMQLLRRNDLVYLSSHRWELKAWSLFPRINLAIRSILSESGAKSFSAPLSGMKSDLGARDEATTLEPGISSLNLADRNSISEFSRLSTQRPLSRVFRRLAGREIETRSRKLLTTESVDITRRVVESRRRVEHSVHTETVTRQEQISRKALEHTKEAERKLGEHLAELNKVRVMSDTAYGISPLSPPAAFSVEQLTEQVIRRIDDQIVARKERMGTLF
jgi:hypothetical protein